MPLRPNCAVTRIATLTVKRPDSTADQANWIVLSGGNQHAGVLQPGWEDKDKFFKYLETARGATLKGEVVQRAVTIKEEAKGGWWKQHNPSNKANTSSRLTSASGTPTPTKAR